MDGQLVSYDNRRLLSAQNAGLENLTVEVVDKNSKFPNSNKTWSQKFKQRFNDIRNRLAGGIVPDKGVKTKPILCKS